MNLLHLKYAVEIAKTHSITKAAENLFMNQPNLSRAVKELEDSLGICIFSRTTKGISVTAQGEEFLVYAKQILKQVDQVEALYKYEGKIKRKFSISVPRASYISAAFTEFSKNIDYSQPIDIFYKETNAIRAVKNILESDYKLGIIRYQQIFDAQFKSMLEEKGLESELICEFSYVALMSKNNPIAAKEKVSYSDISDQVEIAHADPYVPSLPVTEVKKEEYTDNVDKHIYVFERGSQFELLENVPCTFMWVSPVPEEFLDKYNLTQRECTSDNRIYKDMLIYRKGYNFTDLDNSFITELVNAKRKYL